MVCSFSRVSAKWHPGKPCQSAGVHVSKGDDPQISSLRQEGHAAQCQRPSGTAEVGADPACGPQQHEVLSHNTTLYEQCH